MKSLAVFIILFGLCSIGQTFILRLRSAAKSNKHSTKNDLEKASTLTKEIKIPVVDWQRILNYLLTSTNEEKSFNVKENPLRLYKRKRSIIFERELRILQF